jgi:hypothetical protein
MLNSTIKFITAAIAVYGAYKAVYDFLETDTGGKVKSYLSDKKDVILDSAKDYLGKVQVSK